MIKILITLVLLSLSQHAYAQDNALDELLRQFQSHTASWEPIIIDALWGLFWGLTIISFTWSAIQLWLAEKGLTDVIALLFERVMLVGLCVFLITNATSLAWALINSFQTVVTRLSQSSLSFSPSNVFELGWKIAQGVVKSGSGFSVGDYIFLTICALIIVVVFALIAAEMCILIVGSYLIINGGLIMMGFLGSEWTRQHALNYFTTILGMCVQLFMMQLIVLIGYGMFEGFLKQAGDGSADYLVMVAMSIVYYALIRVVPNMSSSLATGQFTFDSGGAVASAAGVAGATAGMTLGAMAMSNSAGGAASKALMKTSMGDGVTQAINSAIGQSSTAQVVTKGLSKSIDFTGRTGSSVLNALAQQSPVGRAFRDMAMSSQPPPNAHQDLLDTLASLQDGDKGLTPDQAADQTLKK